MIMKRFAFYFVVSLLTHFIGIASVLFASFLSTVIVIPQNLPEVREELEVTPLVTFDSPKSETLKLLPKFMPFARGCGNGYAQSYWTSDGQWLSEGVQVFETTKKTRAELNRWITKATRIIERVPNYKNRWGDLGERIVIVNPLDKNGKESVSVLWYGGDNSVSYIDAPTLELALEFEQTNAYAY
jgi:hypothetical protein